MLKIENLRVSYGHIEVLKGISFSVEIVALIGGNGAGKTTTLSTISGLARPTSGTISWKGENIQAAPAIVGSGLAHCPEGRRIFPGLTVFENLVTGTASRSYRKRDIDEDLALVFDLFQCLKERLKQGGWSLSGGEQQMLAIGRALMSRPSLLMLDEPSLGLAPIVIEQVFDRIVELQQTYWPRRAAGRAKFSHGAGNRRPRLRAGNRDDYPVRPLGDPGRRPAHPRGLSRRLNKQSNSPHSNQNRMR
jgi:branched-chain amino acid transport system ATP-binding protein